MELLATMMWVMIGCGLTKSTLSVHPEAKFTKRFWAYVYGIALWPYITSICFYETWDKVVKEKIEWD